VGKEKTMFLMRQIVTALRAPARRRAVFTVAASALGLFAVADFLAYYFSRGGAVDGTAMTAVYLIFAAFAGAGWSVGELGALHAKGRQRFDEAAITRADPSPRLVGRRGGKRARRAHRVAA
jgi:hypothetical protein